MAGRKTFLQRTVAASASPHSQPSFGESNLLCQTWPFDVRWRAVYPRILHLRTAVSTVVYALRVRCSDGPTHARSRCSPVQQGAVESPLFCAFTASKTRAKDVPSEEDVAPWRVRVVGCCWQRGRDAGDVRRVGRAGVSRLSRVRSTAILPRSECISAVTGAIGDAWQCRLHCCPGYGLARAQ